MESSHPREGTATCSCPLAAEDHLRIISSPRGDGNLEDQIMAAANRESSHPREGTATFGHRKDDSNRQNHLIPARGRQLFINYGRVQAIRIISSPRGDGNLLKSTASNTVFFSRIISSPRGDGNVFSASRIAYRAKNHLIPARGRQLTLLSSAPSPAPGIISSPRGDGNALNTTEFLI